MEAMPVAWLEVMACGQLLIAGDAGPAKEIIEHAVSGLLCIPTNASDIASQLRWALQHPQEVLQIRTQARQTAVQQFALSSVLKQNLQLWKG
jgi:glycosyltransferase involved in cell wall biosynthesis